MKNKYFFLLLISALSFGQIVQVKDIYPGSSSSSPSNFFDFNGTLFFRATNGADGVELWKSDGTDTGTILVKNINNTTTLASASNPSNFTIFNNQLYFTASNGSSANGIELWKTDGSANGTTQLQDLRSGGSSNPQYLTILDANTMFFSAHNGTATKLWTMNNTETISVIDYTNADAINWIESLNGKVVYCQTISGQGRELFTSDGTLTNTFRITDISGNF